MVPPVAAGERGTAMARWKAVSAWRTSSLRSRGASGEVAQARAGVEPGLLGVGQHAFEKLAWAASRWPASMASKASISRLARP